MSEIIQFRKMTEADIPAVVAIEREAFSTPWTEEILYHEIRDNQFAYYLVATHEDVLIGHCGMWIVVDECHITNVAVRKAYRGRGIGEQLMRKAMEICRIYHVVRMTLEVRVSNEIAQRLYKKLGFQNGGIRKNYYADDQEDALVMWVEFE